MIRIMTFEKVVVLDVQYKLPDPEKNKQSMRLRIHTKIHKNGGIQLREPNSKRSSLNRYLE